MTSVVLGCNGQDGTFLTRHLLRRGHHVVGVGREESSAQSHESFRYAAVDLSDQEALAKLLTRDQPTRIFHLAAVHTHAGGLSYEDVFDDMLDVNVKSVHTVLEHLRHRSDDPRLLYAGSAKCFGSPLPERIDEATPKQNGCLYSITKNAAASLIAHYRTKHGVAGGVVYLFNHESELRPAPFFIPKLVRALAGTKESFFTLRFHCDWGSAEEYSDIFIDILDKAPGEDFVLATGRCVHALTLATELFESRGLNMADYVEEKNTEPSGAPYRVDLSKLRAHIGRVPQVRIEELVDRMLDRLTLGAS